MKNKFAILVALFLVLSFGLSGCTGALATNPTTTGTPEPTQKGNDSRQTEDLMAGFQAAAWTGAGTLPDEGAIAVINRFAADLFLSSVQNPGNVMVSPASVFLALAMTLNGAETTTKEAMLKVLADNDLSIDEINQASRAWMALLQTATEKTTVSIANSIWFDRDFVPFKPFLQTNADFFGAGASKLDFRDPAAPDVINAWVKESTRGTIEKIIDKIPENAVMYLINSIYFKSDWLEPFEKVETRERDFTTPSGIKQVPFLHRIGPLMTYFTGSDATGIALPYENGRFAYFAILPDDQKTPREWLAAQDQDALFTTLSGLMAQKATFTVDLSMPKFEATYEDSLKNELKTMGMEIAFVPYEADFTQMSDDHRHTLFIGDVKHKTFIRVDEKGTEAAAVTSVEIQDESMISSDVQLTFDRPFVYGIMDMQSHLPLFVGILEDPTA